MYPQSLPIYTHIHMHTLSHTHTCVCTYTPPPPPPHLKAEHDAWMARHANQSGSETKRKLAVMEAERGHMKELLRVEEAISLQVRVGGWVRNKIGIRVRVVGWG